MNHHGADAPESHDHHHGSDPGAPITVHEGHHSPGMTHDAAHVDAKHTDHGGGGHDMTMSMFFHAGDTETILFKFWHTDSALALTLSCLFIFLMAVLYEALKCFREWLFAWNRRRLAGGRDQYTAPRRYREANYNYNQPTYPPRSHQHSGTQIYAYRPRSPSMPPLGNQSPPAQPSAILTPHQPLHHHHVQQDPSETRGPSRLKFLCSRMHLLQTLLHILQVLISFLLMLIFMTFNVWLCLAVLLGAGVGYYIFGAFGSRVSDHCN
ncbi:high affinity copper uptake protein 1 [Drosophila gunungcola]|uniref:Copper transport protein n=1 Tax=Drosophila gunungcola TaxID=103775 RepID=A0A9P9YZ19_9MUSC|nr:high affinity copper uptake protein 1 [Drosophila gunungcola]KAI8045732.1 hypothetical protein M5D96_001916 [Drosophila gunungcola]